MSNICLCKMTIPLCRAYFQHFAYDPDIFQDMASFRTFTYTREHADAHWQRQFDLKREHLAILLENQVIGEIVLKNIDQKRKCCTLGIHLINDSVKNKGYGTQAEILALDYAFSTMGMNTVYADAILKNARSQHVLKKVGFREIRRDEAFVYYICEKSSWKHPEGGSKPANSLL